MDMLCVECIVGFLEFLDNLFAGKSVKITGHARDARFTRKISVMPVKMSVMPVTQNRAVHFISPLN